ncbi:glycosyltransferase family 39 protein [Ruminiclostridium herbifermentans]|uniref:Glycosyltransferase family 39 protein n=1 Tax=Ruminiclostridium herbifermentans TaxID=2488810 RepID=A0A4U7JFG0_9FIRM|nr:glycosyltransferase family 39 protein [Ruminiclostridium herbifermentans]QNU67493.1 glycosyltransferase family 39 protein [Ruminiclostridium herbifermentans]
MNKLKFKDFIFYAIVWGAIALLILISICVIRNLGPSVVKMPFYMGYIYVILSIAAIFILYKVNIVTKINTKVFITLLIIIALVPRFIWVYFVQTQPFSDFLHLHNYGINASQGDFKGFVDFYAVFPFKIGFGMVLAGLYYIFGTGLMVAKLFNVAASVILVILIYTGGKMLYGEKAGRVAALMTALWPAQIMYTSVIASEHLFLILFIASVLLILKFIKKYTYKNYEMINGNLILIGIGVLTACAQLVRPMAMLLLPVFAVFVLLYNKYRANSIDNAGLKLKSIVLVVICYFGLINLVNIPIQNATGVDITKSNGGFNLMIGTNIKSNGTFNTEDFGIIEKNNYDFEKVHKEAKQIAIERLKGDPKHLWNLAKKKYQILWGNENYGYYWSMVAAQNSQAERIIKSHPRAFYGMAQFFYTLVILMALCACFYTLREKRYDALVLLMIFGGILVSYTFLEVQARYHMPVIPILILFGSSFLTEDSKI